MKLLFPEKLQKKKKKKARLRKTKAAVFSCVQNLVLKDRTQENRAGTSRRMWSEVFIAHMEVEEGHGDKKSHRG
jgi:hypothetical protein